MKSVSLLNRLLRDTAGASLVEFSVAFPVLALVALGTVDVSFLLSEWNAAAKATQRGVRAAVVMGPVGGKITDLTYDVAHIGDSCLTSSGGVESFCPTVDTVCTAAGPGSGSCTGDHPFNDQNFQAIFNQMRAVFPKLQRKDVRISYKTTGLGFVGRPGGLPMIVTVSIRCKAHTFFFLGGLMNWIAPPTPADCPDGVAGWPIPPSHATLISEDMVSN